VPGEPITRDITGEEYFSTLYVIEESPVQAGVIWTGANDGPVHVTRDGGESWTDVTPPMPPEGRIQNIDPSPHDAGKAYVAAYRYLLGDFEPYIFKTEDYGQTWERLTDGTNGIPADQPTRVVREDPDREGLLYAGTEFGFFISFDDGVTWQSFQQNLPATPVTDVKIFRQKLAMSTMGRSFWVMDDITPLHEIKDGIDTGGHHLFSPSNAYRIRIGGGYSFGGPDPSAPAYARKGARIDYYLAEDATDGLTLEIMDDAGKVVQTFESGGPPARTEREQGMRGPRQRRTGGAPGASAGMHRFVWDLRYPGPGGSSRGGPMAVPGQYRVRLTVGDWSATHPFEVVMDPRVQADGVTRADLRAQFEFNTRVIDFYTDALETRRRLEGAVDSDEYSGRELEELQRLRALMVETEGISYPQPRLVSQIRYLLGMTSRADQRPGDFAYTRFEELESQLGEIRAGMAEITGGEG
jgi:hypothetical protein